MSNKEVTDEPSPKKLKPCPDPTDTENVLTKAGDDSRTRKYDLNKLTLSETLTLLSSQGYKLRTCSQAKGLNDMYPKDTNTNIICITIPDGESGPEDAKYYRDYGYYLCYFETEEESHSFMGCLNCGGLYTCAALFDGEKNLAREVGPGKHGDWAHILPKGDIEIECWDFDDDDDEDDIEESNKEEGGPTCDNIISKESDSEKENMEPITSGDSKAEEIISWKQQNDESKVKYDMNKLSFTEALDLLHTQGYKFRNELVLYPQSENTKFVCINVPDGESGPYNAKYYKDFGYCLGWFETMEEAVDEYIGCILHGGLYTCLALFEGEKNLAERKPNGEHIDWAHMLPKGDTKCC